jgi:predicted nucleic acid-binding Zn ribbon protein
MSEEKGKLVPLKDVIASLLQDSRLPFNPADAHIWEVWQDVVGQAIARHAHPAWIKNARLRILVSDPIWIQELEFLSNDIKAKLNQKLGRNAVDTIEFRLGTR